MEVISFRGVGDLALQTINKRYGVAYKAIIKIKAIVQDVRSSVPGGFLSGLKLWEMAVVQKYTSIEDMVTYSKKLLLLD